MPRWKVVAASVRGRSHEILGQPCQDSYHWALLPGGLLAIALGDGAGTARLAEIGAALATHTVVETLIQHIQGHGAVNTEHVSQRLLPQAVDATRKTIAREAVARGVNSRDLATTLVVALATPLFVVAGQVGDGGVVVADTNGTLTTLSSPQRGEYLNETHFIVSEDAMDCLQVAVFDGGVANIAVFTDGLQLLALRSPQLTPHGPFFSPLFDFVTHVHDSIEAHAQLGSFLRSSRVAERTDDDVTLCLAALVG